MRVLLVEDDNMIGHSLRQALTENGLSVDWVRDGVLAQDALAQGAYSAVLLDLGLPRRSGLEVLRRARQEGNRTPMLVLTARDGLDDRVSGLDLGADDYLVKPFEMAELLARIEALLRRGATPASAAPIGETFRFGDISIDFRKAEVMKSGQSIDLSAREFKLLRYFVEHRGAALSRDELLNEVWGYNAMPSTRTVDVHVAWLRQKIEDNPRHPQYIHTVHGLGYKFVV